MIIVVSKYRFLGWVSPPISADVDIANICSLRCPFCATGRRLKRESPPLMGLDQFKKIVDSFGKIKSLGLVVSGEPFHNKSFFEMVRYTKQKGIQTKTHSHFSFSKDESFFRELVKSGLDMLYLSIDGATKEGYRTYRVGGDFELVIRNLRKLIEQKKLLKSNTPKVIWKFIVNKHNETEVDAARNLAHSLGVEFMTDSLLLGEHLVDIEAEAFELQKKEWIPSQTSYQEPKYAPCPNLFLRPAIGSDGSVYPCCFVQSMGEPWGNLNQQSMGQIWNGEKYKSARDYFLGRGKIEDCPKACLRCTLYKPC